MLPSRQDHAFGATGIDNFKFTFSYPLRNPLGSTEDSLSTIEECDNSLTDTGNSLYEGTASPPSPTEVSKCDNSLPDTSSSLSKEDDSQTSPIEAFDRSPSSSAASPLKKRVFVHLQSSPQVPAKKHRVETAKVTQISSIRRAIQPPSGSRAPRGLMKYLKPVSAGQHAKDLARVTAAANDFRRDQKEIKRLRMKRSHEENGMRMDL